MDSQDPAPDIKSEPISVKVRRRNDAANTGDWRYREEVNYARLAAFVALAVGCACWRLFFGE